MFCLLQKPKSATRRDAIRDEPQSRRVKYNNKCSKETPSSKKFGIILKVAFLDAAASAFYIESVTDGADPVGI